MGVTVYEIIKKNVLPDFVHVVGCSVNDGGDVRLDGLVLVCRRRAVQRDVLHGTTQLRHRVTLGVGRKGLGTCI